jgi:hypothetical protein
MCSAEFERPAIAALAETVRTQGLIDVRARQPLACLGFRPQGLCAFPLAKSFPANDNGTSQSICWRAFTVETLPQKRSIQSRIAIRWGVEK